jgi:hypothetical protein
MTPHKPAHALADDDLLPELPPLEDDGSLFEADDPHPMLESEEGGLDDATGEDEPLDRFGALADAQREEEGSTLEGAEGDDDLPVTDARDLVAGAELGLLEDSDEGDGRELSAEEAGTQEQEERTADDGGAEGTGEDPAEALDVVAGELRVDEASDDEGFDDVARFEDAAAAHARLSMDRAVWPRRADRGWVVARCDDDDLVGTTTEPAVEGLAADAREGALVVSDDGVRWRRVPGCTGVTALAVWVSTNQRSVFAALHDAARDAAAVVLVRVGDEPTAEVIADWMADEADDDVRITSLHLRPRRDGPHATVEVVARGAFGVVSIAPRGRG